MILEPDDEHETGDNHHGEPSRAAVDEATLRAEVEKTLDSLREALDGSLQLSRMIAELEEKLADLKKRPAAPAADEPGALGETATDQNQP